MKIKYLGTAAAEGWPGLFCTCESCRAAAKLGGKNIRTRSQAIIDDTLLVDFPADSYMHMLTYGLDLPHIHHLLITHTHQDHLYLEELTLRSEWFAQGIDGLLNIYGNDAMAAKYKRCIGSEAHHKVLDGKLAVTELCEFVSYNIANYTVTPLLANHAKNEKCFLYIIEKDGKRLFYGNDTGFFPQATWDFIRGMRFDLISLDCTMLKHKDGNNHMGIADVLEVKERLCELGCIDSSTTCVITHFSHNGGLLHHEIEATMFKHGFLTAYDGMEVEL
ncbi:MAG: MBL fold metallo-hydrolase [Angelakisella sp.]